MLLVLRWVLFGLNEHLLGRGVRVLIGMVFLGNHPITFLDVLWGGVGLDS